jgi:hypothetical protein
MSDQVPEPLEVQLRRAREARDPFSRESFLSVTLGTLALDVLLVAMGWVAGSPSRVALTLLGIDAGLLVAWVVIGIPLRRWLARSPY